MTLGLAEPGSSNLAETTTYNSRLQMTERTLGSVLDLSYSYGSSMNNGNLLTQTIGGGLGVTQTYTYDSLNRLKMATEANSSTTWKQTYVYDQYGNRAMMSGSGYYTPTADAFHVSTDSPSALSGHSTNNRSDVCSVYDIAGNATTCGSSLAGSYTYDAENRVLTAGSAATFTYDGDGHRISKTSGSTTTYSVYDAMGQMAAEYGGPSAVAGRQNLTADNLGSTRMVTNGTSVISRPRLLAVRRRDAPTLQSPIDSTVARLRYRRRRHREVHRQRARRRNWPRLLRRTRYLSSAQGRWMSPDWCATPQAIPYDDLSDPQSLNLYGYVRNNPLGRADADGHDFLGLRGPKHD